jgi:hypothetical protein
MDAVTTANQLVVPVSWVLGIIGVLGGVIATLAGIIFRSLNERLSVQDRIIEKLQDDIDRLAKGCGATTCIWKNR